MTRSFANFRAAADEAMHGENLGRDSLPDDHGGRADAGDTGSLLYVLEHAAQRVNGKGK